MIPSLMSLIVLWDAPGVRLEEFPARLIDGQEPQRSIHSNFIQAADVDGQQATSHESNATPTYSCEGERAEIFDLHATSQDCNADVNATEGDGVDGQLNNLYELQATSTQEVSHCVGLSSLEGERAEMFDLHATSRDVSPRDSWFSDGDDMMYLDDVKTGTGCHSDSEYVPSDSSESDDETDCQGLHLSRKLSVPDSLSVARMDRVDFKDQGLGRGPFDTFEHVKTSSSGKTFFFSIQNPMMSTITATVVDKRVRKTIDSPHMTFVECRSFPAPGLSSHCHNCLVVYQHKPKSKWRLGVIDTLQYKVVKRDRIIPFVLRVYEWVPCVGSRTKPTSSSESKMPIIFSDDKWENIKCQFQHREISYGDYPEMIMKFINQVMGPMHKGFRNDTFCTMDLGVQSSPSGPDRLRPGCPKSQLLPTTGVVRIDLSQDLEYFKLDERGNIIKIRLYRKSLSKFNDDLVRRYASYRPPLVNRELDSNHCVVQCHNNSKTIFSIMKSPFHAAARSYLIPSLSSIYTRRHCSNWELYFYVVPIDKYEELRGCINGSKYPSNEFASTIDEKVKSYCTSKLRCIVMNADKHDDFVPTCVYAGSSAPSVTDEAGWDEIYDDTRGMSLYLKRGKCGDYSGRMPLSSVYMTNKSHSRRFDRMDVDIMH